VVFAFADMAFRLNCHVSWVVMGFAARLLSGRYPDMAMQCEIQAVATRMLAQSGLRGLPKDFQRKYVPVFVAVGLIFLWAVLPSW